MTYSFHNTPQETGECGTLEAGAPPCNAHIQLCQRLAHLELVPTELCTVQEKVTSLTHTKAWVLLNVLTMNISSLTLMRRYTFPCSSYSHATLMSTRLTTYYWKYLRNHSSILSWPLPLRTFTKQLNGKPIDKLHWWFEVRFHVESAHKGMSKDQWHCYLWYTHS